MSNKAISATWNFPTDTPGAKLVLVNLADHADASGRCWPKQKTISNETGLSVDTVQRRLEELETLGAVVREPRYKVTGARRSDLYHVTLPGFVQVGQFAVLAPLPNTAAQRFYPTALVRSYDEPSVEPSKKEESVDVLFDGFLSLFPEPGRAPATEARAAYDGQIKRGADPKLMDAGARRYAEKMRGAEPKYVTSAAKFLRTWSPRDEKPISSTAIFITSGTPQWLSWHAYNEKHDKKFSLKIMDENAALSKPFPVITEYPPEELKEAIAA
jgi:DNA-binding transcriptional MocR family regulator